MYGFLLGCPSKLTVQKNLFWEGKFTMKSLGFFFNVEMSANTGG